MNISHAELLLFGFFFHYRDDDDINDVASMAGVNLNEESARIMATNSDLVGTQIQSCKDEPFLAAIPLHKRILEMAKKLGITDVPAEVVTFISHATQNRLRTVIEKVTVITQHRMESYKDDEWYEQATDVRSQLKFFEQLERLEKQRKDEQEREILLKAAKSRSRQEDPEQARLKQKAKEMQQQELAQMRQRDANLTALAAIGPRKKRKLDSPGLLTIGGEIQTIILPFLLFIHLTATLEKRMVKALDMSFFGIINLADFLSTSHSVVLRFWGGSTSFLQHGKHGWFSINE
uniref:Transcription initiation factor TFIID component TAF4 C-terminal domain-containing protein n=4 Tax=Neoaves TaxID=3078114 RepID=A0A8B9N6K4_9AVES